MSERAVQLYAVSIGALFFGAMVSPLFKDPPRDSFPLSDYPMFSSVREAAFLQIAVGVDGDGTEHRLPPFIIANREVMQAAQTLRRAVRQNRSYELCREIAGRVASSRAHAALERIRIESRLFDPARYFSEPDGSEPIERRRHAECRVRR
ncbi:MAG: hypothetical protein GX614_02960 [Sandaracinaceae bacterium]|nr:hypothetical protein [Sandaracinaceae bacterium]